MDEQIRQAEMGFEPEAANFRNQREVLYFWTVLLLGAGLFVLTLTVSPHFWRINPLDFILFLLLNVVAELTYVVLPQGSRISASFAIILACLVIFNPPIAILIATMGALIAMGLIHQRGWRITLFNMAQYATTYSLAGLLMIWIHEKVSPVLGMNSLFESLVMGGGATAVYLLLNLPLVNAYLAIKQNPTIGWPGLWESVIRVREERIEVFQTLFFYPIAVLVAYSYQQEHNPVIPVVLAFLVFGGLRFIEQRRRIERQREKNEVLYQLTKRMSESVLQDADVELQPGHVFEHLFSSNAASIKRLVINQRTSVYQVETIGDSQRIVHKKADTMLEPEKIYPMDDKGFLQLLVKSKQGVRTTDMSQLGGAYVPWRIAYQSLMAQPILVDEEVAFILVMFRVAGDAFSEQDERILKLLINAFEITLKNIQLRNQIQAQAIKDGLMGIFNHRYLKSKLEEEMHRSKRYKSPLTLIITDVDYFKKFNDTHGHLLGDRVLKEIAVILADSVRETDIVARYGGEELAILLPETPLDAACEVAERIRKNIAEYPFIGKDNQPVAMSVSIGVSCLFNEVELEPSELIVRTDTALYRAKHQGRNQICKSFLENGRLVIETYSRGHAPRPADEVTGSGQELIQKLLPAWNEQMNKSESDWRQSLEQQIQIAALDPAAQSYFEKRFLPVVPALLDGLFATPLHDNGQIIADSDLAHVLERLQNSLSRRLQRREELQLLQQLLMRINQHYITQVLTMPLAENGRSTLLKRGMSIILQIQERLFAASLDGLASQIRFSDSHYHFVKALLQVVAHPANTSQTMTRSPIWRQVLREIQNVIAQSQQIFLYLGSDPSPSTEQELLVALPSSSLPQVLALQQHPDFSQAKLPPLLEIKGKNLSQYIKWQSDQPEANLTTWLLLPLWLESNYYGLLGVVLETDQILSHRQRHWLNSAAHELAETLQLIQNLPDLHSMQMHTLRQLVDVAQGALGSFTVEEGVSLARRLAQRLQLPTEQQTLLRDALYLYRLGHLLHPSSSKSSHKNPWQPAAKPQMLNQRLLESLSVQVPARIVRHIHEHWDGTGFPDGLSGEQIPLLSRLLGLVIAWQGLSHDPAEELDSLEKDGQTGYYDPTLCSLLKEIIRENHL